MLLSPTVPAPAPPAASSPSGQPPVASGQPPVAWPTPGVGDLRPFSGSPHLSSTMSQFQNADISPEVIRAAAAGDAAAYEAIYRAHQRAVFTLVRRLIPRVAVAEEVFQDVFVEVLRSMKSYSGSGSLAGWIRTIAVNKCMMYLRSPWHRSLFWLDAQQDDESPAITLTDGATLTELHVASQRDLERALANLPAITRSVVWLHDVEGYTHGEIAQALGRTVSFSKSQLARAHIRLREMLEPATESLPCTPVSTNC